MTHPPQEILIKVMCSERLPENEGRYYTYTDNDTSPFGTNYFNGNRFETFPFIDVIAWYEPATRVVLTVEELNSKIASIAKTVTEKQRAAKEEQTDGVDWNTLEEIWFDWIKEQFIGNEDDTDNP